MKRKIISKEDVQKSLSGHPLTVTEKDGMMFTLARKTEFRRILKNSSEIRKSGMNIIILQPNEEFKIDDIWACEAKFAELVFDEILDYIKLPESCALYEHLSVNQNRGLNFGSF